MKYKQIAMKHKLTVNDILKLVGLHYNNEELIDDKKIEKLIGGFAKEYADSCPRYGKRAWKFTGKKKVAIVWDCGNSWYQLIKLMTPEEEIEDEI